MKQAKGGARDVETQAGTGYATKSATGCRRETAEALKDCESNQTTHTGDSRMEQEATPGKGLAFFDREENERAPQSPLKPQTKTRSVVISFKCWNIGTPFSFSAPIV